MNSDYLKQLESASMQAVRQYESACEGLEAVEAVFVGHFLRVSSDRRVQLLVKLYQHLCSTEEVSRFCKEVDLCEREY